MLDRARAFALAAHARHALQGAKVGLFGYVSMGNVYRHL
jgi:hypothetical protein